MCRLRKPRRGRVESAIGARRPFAIAFGDDRNRALSGSYR